MIPTYWRCPEQLALFRNSGGSGNVISHAQAPRRHRVNRWAEELIEHAYLDPEIEEWANEAE